jgi:hypothetical protein
MFIERPFTESVQDAPVIVRGRAGMSYANWSHGSDGRRRIYTFTELQVDEVLKGTVSSKSITMRELGGEKDGVGMQVVGAVRFERGEDVVVFLSEANPDGVFDVRGMMMSKYNIEKTEEDKEYLTGPGLSGSAHSEGRHVEPGIAPESGVRHHEKETGQNDTSLEGKWTLDSLRKVIHDQAKGILSQQKEEKNLLNQSVETMHPSIGNKKKTDDLPAPRLQPLTPETSSRSPWGLVLLGVGGSLGIIGVFVVLWRRRS